jgi:hypothetical protein
MIGAGSARLVRDTLVIDSVVGERGSAGRIAVRLPASARVNAALVNGTPVPQFTRRGDLIVVPAQFGQRTLGPMFPVIRWDSAFTGGRVSGELRIPRDVFEQLQARRAAWPIPWTADDYRTTWLAAERLLLWAPIASGDDSADARLWIDGQPVEFRKSYTSIQTERSAFTGFHADISALAPDRVHRIELDLAKLGRGRFLGLYVENVEPVYVPATVRH